MIWPDYAKYVRDYLKNVACEIYWNYVDKISVPGDSISEVEFSVPNDTIILVDEAIIEHYGDLGSVYACRIALRGYKAGTKTIEIPLTPDASAGKFEKAQNFAVAKGVAADGNEWEVALLFYIMNDNASNQEVHYAVIGRKLI